MTETLDAHLYDYPKYYDLVYGSDWKAEFDFLEDCFAHYTPLTVQRLFEPACGTGRLMIKLAKAGYEIAGNDLNEHAVNFCNDRLIRNGFPGTAVVEDMADFRVKRKVDAAFNMINSFRHLPDESTAEAHLLCVANALKKGGLYCLGLHLTPLEGERIEEESWSARRGNLMVISSLWSEGIDHAARIETVGMSFDIYTPLKHMKINDQMNYRTYTHKQMQALLNRVGSLEVVETFDFSYDLENPIDIDDSTEDVVYVLRKC